MDLCVSLTLIKLLSLLTSHLLATAAMLHMLPNQPCATQYASFEFQPDMYRIAGGQTFTYTPCIKVLGSDAEPPSGTVGFRSARQ